MYKRINTRADIKPAGEYTYCEFLPIVGISRSQFKRLAPTIGILPHSFKRRGKMPRGETPRFYYGREILRFDKFYN